MQIISSIAELDAKLAECDAAGKISDDALREVFKIFRMDFTDAVPADPFSIEYRDFQMDLYQRISSRTYNPRNASLTSRLLTAVPRDRPSIWRVGRCAAGV